MNKKFSGILRDTKGQDLIEYALMVGFVAVAAGAIAPGISVTIRGIFDKIAVSMGTMSSHQATPLTTGGEWPLFRIFCAALAALFLGVIVWRHRNNVG